MNLNPMKWKWDGEVNTGNIITIGIILFGLIGGIITYQLTIKSNTSEIEELNARIQNLNERQQNSNRSWDDLILRLDERYVNQNQFNEFRNNLSTQLKYIREDTRYMRKQLDDQ